MYITLAALTIYIILLTILSAQSDGKGNLDRDLINYSTNLWTGFWIFMAVIVAAIAFLIITVKKIENLVKTRIQAYRLDQESANIFLRLKEETWRSKF
jgi:hypothetical protein